MRNRDLAAASPPAGVAAGRAVMAELVGRGQFVARWRDRALGLDDLARLVLADCVDLELRATAQAYLVARAALLEELENLGFE
jgi:hypothetical protein